MYIYVVGCVQVVTTFFDFPMLFDAKTGKPLNEGLSQADTMMYGCSCLRLSPDDRLVVSCSTDGSVRVGRVSYYYYGTCNDKSGTALISISVC